MNSVIKLISFLFFIITISAWTVDNVSNDEASINWLTWEEAIEKSEDDNKKIIVDVYTSWCSWCKKMDDNTFQDPIVVDYINENFYAVKFDAEYKETIKFNDKEYKYIKSGKRGYHELAVWLMQGKMSYPTTVFIDEDLQVIQAIPGYRSLEEFEPIMTYFGGDYYKSTPWVIYQKKFKPSEPEAKPVSE